MRSPAFFVFNKDHLMKKKWLLSGLIVFFLIFSALNTTFVSAQTQTEAPLFTFVQVSDLHIINGKSTKKIEKAIENINLLDPLPKFIVATGDLINGESPKESIELYKELFSALKCPIYSVLGNHDPRPYFRKIPADYNYSFDVLPYHFVVLDDVSSGSNGVKFPEYTIEWLEKHMGSVNKKTPIILFAHASIFRKGAYPDTMTSDVHNYGPILEILKPFNVIAWFAGHGHANSQAEKDGVVYYATGSLSDNRANSNCQSGYRIVKVFKDRVETIFVSVK